MKKQIKVGNVLIGGDAPIVVQSMVNKRDKDEILVQITALKDAGCQLVRLAVPDEKMAHELEYIIKKSVLPIIADIHFDYKLALIAIAAGVSKVRINPGNIGSEDKIKAVVDACKEKNIPIRIGVNSGSLEKWVLEKYGRSPEGMVASAFHHIGILNKFGFDDICISLKSSNVTETMQAYMLMHEKSDYPLHLGVTEAGTEYMGTIKSAAGIGGLLALGIGDTIRVSLTADPIREIAVAKSIIKATGRSDSGIDVISCPSCGRCKIALIDIANEVEQKLAKIDKKLTVAVMGCAVNGPGEASHADIGIAGGDGEGLIFKKGKIFKKVPEADIVAELMQEIEKI